MCPSPVAPCGFDKTFLWEWVTLFYILIFINDCCRSKVILTFSNCKNVQPIHQWCVPNCVLLHLDLIFRVHTVSAFTLSSVWKSSALCANGRKIECDDGRWTLSTPDGRHLSDVADVRYYGLLPGRSIFCYTIYIYIYIRTFPARRMRMTRLRSRYRCKYLEKTLIVHTKQHNNNKTRSLW